VTFTRTKMGPAAVITIDRPEKRNALTLPAIAELTEYVRDAGQDPAVAGLVLTGNGAFCAGADLKTLVAKGQEGADGIQETIEEIPQQLIRALLDLPVPTVAALNGPAIGMGMDIALACDSRLLSGAGWMMQGWGRVGLIPGTGGELLLRERNGSILWRLLEEQRPIDGAQAERWGLGESVDEDAVTAAVRRIEALAKMPRAALSTYVSMFRSGLKARLDEHLAMCARAQVALLTSEAFAVRVAEVIAPTP
jgi:2-(1,2-epoxy-1,2-dihydrophenyl)acetyl-CoA isomerase